MSSLPLPLRPAALPPPPTAAAIHAHAHVHALHPPLPQSSELHLLQDVLAAWHGFPSALFPPAVDHESNVDGHSSSSCVVRPRHVRYVHLRSIAHLSSEAVVSTVADLVSLINLRADVNAFVECFGGERGIMTNNNGGSRSNGAVSTAAGDRSAAQPQRTAAGRCLQAFCASLCSILERYDLQLLDFEQELQRQMHALATGQPFLPFEHEDKEEEDGGVGGDADNSTGVKQQQQMKPKPRRNVPLTLLSLQQYVAPLIPQMVLLGDLLHQLAPQLYEESPATPSAAMAAAAAAVVPPPPTSAALLSLLHSSLELQVLLSNTSLSSMLFGLLLASLGPYMDYLDAFTSRGHLSTRAEEDEFMVMRRRKKAEPQYGPVAPQRLRPEPLDDGSLTWQQHHAQLQADLIEELSSPPEADTSDELVLRLGSDGLPVAPSFLQPYAQHILLTGRNRAMVQSMKRLHAMDRHAHAPRNHQQHRRSQHHHRAASTLHHHRRTSTMDASLQQRAQWRQQPQSAAADDEWDDDADNDAEAPSNLFTAFHAGLKELFAPTPSSSSAVGGVDVADNGAGGDNSKLSDEEDEDDRISSTDDSAYDDDDTDISETDDEQKNEEDEEEEDGGSTTNRSRHSAASSPRSRRSSRRSEPPRLQVADAAAAASIASDAAADSTSATAGVASALPPPLTSSEKEQLSIFFMPPDDFDAVHPLFKPMPEPPLQPLLLLPADSAKSTTATVGAPTHQSRGAASFGGSRNVSAPGSPRSRPSAEPVATAAASLATDRSPCGPRLVPSLSASLAPSSAIAVLPAVLRRDVHTEAACAEPGRVRGRDPVRYEAAEQEQEENGGPQPSKPASNNANLSAVPSDGGASAFLASVPLCRSLFSMHRLSELLLFHAHFPLPCLAGGGGSKSSSSSSGSGVLLARCLVQPLLRRHEQATQSFIHHVMHTCGLHDHLSSLRELFLGGDGFLAHALCSELFAKLDAGQGEADILGLDFALQDVVTRHASPMLRRTLATTLTLGLLPPPPPSSAARRRGTAAAAAAAAVVAGPEAPDDPAMPVDVELPELAAPEDPQSLVGLEQLELRVTIAWPLSSIVTSESLKGYNKIWHLLLQLRRAEMALNDCALSGCSAAPHSVANRRSRAAALAGASAASRSGGGGGAPPSSSSSSLPPTAGRVLSRTSKYFVNASGVQHAFYLLKAELQHFLRHMLAYVLGRAAEGCWKPLLRALHKHARSGDTEQIRQLHDKYIEDILFQCMLTPKLTVALDAIKRVLGLCLDLRLLHRTVLVDYMEGQPGDYVFDPPATSSAASGRSSASSFAWSTMTGRSTSAAESSTRRGSVDLDAAAAGAGAGEEGSSSHGGGSGGGTSSFDRPPPRRICLPGVHSFAQLQVRLYETSMAQLALLRNELRQTVRFLLTLLNSIVEHGVNAQLHAVLVALQFNDFYKFDA